MGRSGHGIEPARYPWSGDRGVAVIGKVRNRGDPCVATKYPTATGGDHFAPPWRCLPPCRRAQSAGEPVPKPLGHGHRSERRDHRKFPLELCQPTPVTGNSLTNSLPRNYSPGAVGRSTDGYTCIGRWLLCGGTRCGLLGRPGGRRQGPHRTRLSRGEPCRERQAAPRTRFRYAVVRRWTASRQPRPRRHSPLTSPRTGARCRSLPCPSPDSLPRSGVNRGEVVSAFQRGTSPPLR